jgi:hypothetical protein
LPWRREIWAERIVVRQRNLSERRDDLMGLWPSLWSPRRVTAQATMSRCGAGDPSGLVAGPGLRTSVCAGVRSDIRVRPGIRTTPGICPSLCRSGSGSRRLCQTQWYCRNAHHNHSEFNPVNLSHVIFPPSASPFVWATYLSVSPPIFRTRSAIGRSSRKADRHVHPAASDNHRSADHSCASGNSSFSRTGRTRQSTISPAPQAK